jgi:hypothetical protein
MEKRWQTKPTDLQRAVLRAARDDDPSKRIVGTQYAQAAKTLAERGYITLLPYENGLRVELTDLVTRHPGIHAWRRFPPFPRHWRWKI